MHQCYCLSPHGAQQIGLEHSRCVFKHLIQITAIMLMTVLMELEMLEELQYQ